MTNIYYTYNWNNKLDCLAFTTIRLRNDQVYYKGMVANVILKKVDRGPVIIVGIKHFLLHELNEFMARIDTGYSKEKTIAIIQTMYKNRNINWKTQQLSFILQKKLKTK
ncbi:MAG: hypothetical protein QM503_10615 [Bacteroidota bacterium]